jgi:ferrous iron transport protein B
METVAKSASPLAANRTPETVPLRNVPASNAPRIVLVGNPNVGKSVIFGHLTGRYATVSNYPGTTVTVTRGKAKLDGRSTEVIDTPGVLSLVPMSEDERVSRDILLERRPDVVVQVTDAKNLRRSLLITSQLAEMALPVVLDLNMSDEAEDLGVRIDREALERSLGVPVVRTVAVRRKGFDDLRQAIRTPRVATWSIAYPAVIEDAVRDMLPLLPDVHVSGRSLGLMLLANGDTLLPWLESRIGTERVLELENIRRRATVRAREPLGSLINRARLRAVDELLAGTERRPARRPGSFLESLGQWAMHPLAGIPVLLVVLFAMYQFVGVFGAGTAVNFLEHTVFGHYLSPWAIHAADFLFRFPHTHSLDGGVPLADYTATGQLHGWPVVARFLHDLLVGPYGQVTMALSYAIALILPIVSTFFIAFGLLEDSGYLPRLAVMVNRVFRVLGLNGKAVLPMVLGLGCDTMATLTTRILETKKERVLVTFLLALAVPCSAQLGVVLGMIRALSFAATLVWAGTILFTLLLVGWVAAQLVPGQCSDFILELPPIRRPELRNIFIKTMARIEWYLREAVPLFLFGTLLLFVLETFHLLSRIERIAAPVVHGILGLPPQAAQAFLIGFLRRDYGAAGLYQLSRQGQLDSVQLIVSMVTITLFIPCVANFMIMIKERGWKTAAGMAAFIVPFSFVVGGLLNWGLRALKVTF